jgi:hypothetical protein
MVNASARRGVRPARDKKPEENIVVLFPNVIGWQHKAISESASI